MCQMLSHLLSNNSLKKMHKIICLTYRWLLVLAMVVYSLLAAITFSPNEKFIVLKNLFDYY